MSMSYEYFGDLAWPDGRTSLILKLCSFTDVKYSRSSLKSINALHRVCIGIPNSRSSFPIES
eukprot:CAMPEP_0198136524 /NCGR_PEP_ID=MMETSP1443-20131203/170_1 /TAXON_ID=186043 /ORGANISM="Entomoneis sp., Strain CCMP2396" /LENGTH=61 /DNA_ID=CAMNT_0043797759 /DNA_START=94 /DNA_END=279 /DNA_ORIENTATION=-